MITQQFASSPFFVARFNILCLRTRTSAWLSTELGWNFEQDILISLFINIFHKIGLRYRSLLHDTYGKYTSKVFVSREAFVVGNSSTPLIVSLLDFSVSWTGCEGSRINLKSVHALLSLCFMQSTGTYVGVVRLKVMQTRVSSWKMSHHCSDIYSYILFT